MIFKAGDWSLSVDTEQTMAYCSQKLPEHCQCGYCRNFYAAIDLACPKLRPVLAKFGVHIETPDELMPFEPTLFEATYCICGSILQRGASAMSVNGVHFKVLDQTELDFETECPKPYFALVTPVLELPWVLEEDMDEVISPANEPEYLQRMWRKLLDNAPDEIMLS